MDEEAVKAAAEEAGASGDSARRAKQKCGFPASSFWA